MGKYELTCGIRQKALRVVLYGPEGIGKTTLAAEFPNVVFIDVEGGSDQLPVARMPRPTSWTMLMDEVRAVRDGQVPCSTLVIDTADASERLCIEDICSRNNFDSIEAPGYGKGYTYVAESFGKLLDLLSEVVDKGTNVVMVAHAVMRKFERPDESGAYDRFEMKLSKKAAPMVKEWADMVLFLDYDIIVTINKDKKAKASGGRRVIRTTHTPQWDAKNRFGLADELPLAWESISTVVPDMRAAAGQEAPLVPRTAPEEPAKAEATPTAHKTTGRTAEVPMAPGHSAPVRPARLRPLYDLMEADAITEAEVRHAVAKRGDFPEECAIEDYKPDYVDFLVSQWAGVAKKILFDRIDVPFSETDDTK